MSPDRSHIGTGPNGPLSAPGGDGSPGEGMSRRRFLAGAAGVVGSVGLAGCSVTHANASASSLTGHRGPAARTEELDTDWLFGGLLSPGSTNPNFDDRAFARVNLPHTVTPLSWRHWDPTSWEQVWIYRRHFNRPANFTGLRVFVDITAAMTNAGLTLNGEALAPHEGGYLPCTREITTLVTEHDNVLAVALDSRFQLDVPPNRPAPYRSSSIDFYQPGGLYRHARLRAVPSTFISDVFAKPVDVLSPSRRLVVNCTIDAEAVPAHPLSVEVSLSDATHTIGAVTAPVRVTAAGTVSVDIELGDLGSITLWDVDQPQLYDVTATLVSGGTAIHDHRCRVGFREATFTEEGFFLNGRRLKIFGLNRHQFYPFAGGAMADRIQRRDATILHDELNCNMVRCSHYPQSEAFVDACDELGMLVWEEAPGWGYLGDSAWLAAARQNVQDMVERDRNHPSIVIWGARLNESPNNVSFDTAMKELVDSLDGSRPTSGATDGLLYTDTNAEYVMDVFAYDDYTQANGQASLLPPRSGLPYLVTEAVGSLSGPSTHYRRTDTESIQQGQTVAHALVHDIAASSDRYCGLLGWCAFDYCSGQGFAFGGVKYNGVCDIFRVPKPGAAIYRSQVDPAVRPVIEPSFYWDFDPPSPPDGPGTGAVVCSNCDYLEFSVDRKMVARATPDRSRFPHLQYPPTTVDLSPSGSGSPVLRIDGFVGGRKVLTRVFSSDHRYDRLKVEVDDERIVADGSDATRVVFRAVDRFGAPRPFVTGVVTLDLSGPAHLVGDRSFDFAAAGGVGAVWVRSLAAEPGRVVLTATHPVLGTGQVVVRTV